MEKILTLDKIKETAIEIIKKVSKNSNSKATILAFYGDLGAGKTTITQDIAKQLGISESVISPTFVIMKIYKTKNQKFKKLIHIDAYRLKESSELLHLGWEEMIKDKDNLIIVEWPERVPECVASGVYNIKLGHVDKTTRSIELRGID